MSDPLSTWVDLLAGKYPEGIVMGDRHKNCEAPKEVCESFEDCPYCKIATLEHQLTNAGLVEEQLVQAVEAWSERFFKLEQQLRWRDVTEELPEDGQPVFVYCKDGAIRHVPYIGVFPIVMINWDTGVQEDAVTHWKPITAPGEE